MKQLDIWTDGAYSSSRSSGGVGLVILEGDNIIKEFGYTYKNVTNIKMEVAAVILALRFIKEPCESIVIHTDSQYVIGQATQNWKRNKNKALLSKLDEELERVKELCPDVKFEHIRGHEGVYWNEYVDKIAVKYSHLM